MDNFSILFVSDSESESDSECVPLSLVAVVEEEDVEAHGPDDHHLDHGLLVDPDREEASLRDIEHRLSHQVLPPQPHLSRSVDTVRIIHLIVVPLRQQSELPVLAEKDRECVRCTVYGQSECARIPNS